MGNAQERRYRPPECCSAVNGAVCGNPNEGDFSTRYGERASLTMRTGMRRFTRLTNGFSKKLECTRSFAEGSFEVEPP